MNKILHIVRKDEIIKNVIELVGRFPISLWGGLINRKYFQDIKTYCMFIGYPRSGHSLVGSLLDAHPNMVIAHELHALKYLFAGFRKYQVFYLLIKKSQEFIESGCIWDDYSYRVPNQWQGKFHKLQIIGD